MRLMSHTQEVNQVSLIHTLLLTSCSKNDYPSGMLESRVAKIGKIWPVQLCYMGKKGRPPAGSIILTLSLRVYLYLRGGGGVK